MPFPNKECDFGLPGTADFIEIQNKTFPRLISPKPVEEKDTKQEHKTDRHDHGKLFHFITWHDTDWVAYSLESFN